MLSPLAAFNTCLSTEGRLACIVAETWRQSCPTLWPNIARARSRLTLREFAFKAAAVTPAPTGKEPPPTSSAMRERGPPAELDRALEGEPLDAGTLRGLEDGEQLAACSSGSLLPNVSLQSSSTWRVGMWRPNPDSSGATELPRPFGLERHGLNGPAWLSESRFSSQTVVSKWLDMTRGLEARPIERFTPSTSAPAQSV